MVDFSGCKRILLKISGEALMGAQKFGVDENVCRQIAHGIDELRRSGKEVGIVVGGGNIFRGVKGSALGMARSTADSVGMLATMINGIMLKTAIEKAGSECLVMSAIECPKVVEPFVCEKAVSHLKEGRVVVFVGGTGNPFFTTDTAAALRASEIEADIFLKATKVDGVYNKDPKKHSDAIKYDTLSYSQALAEKLQVMDLTAITLCMENKIPIFVFKIFSEIGIVDMLSNPKHGTIVGGE